MAQEQASKIPRNRLCHNHNLFICMSRVSKDLLEEVSLARFWSLLSAPDRRDNACMLCFRAVFINMVRGLNVLRVYIPVIAGEPVWTALESFST